MDGTADGQAKARILLLYSQADQARDLVATLSTVGYEVISCPATALAGRWVEELEPDLTVLAPPADKKRLLESCESVRDATGGPLLVLSERGEELLVARAFAAGIDEYLVLPMGGRELAARIEALLRRSRREGELDATRRVGALTLSSADHSVERAGRTAFLSPIEFRLLSCLASAPGNVLTHQTLMSRVWGAEYVDSRHYLRLYIRYLREKLEDDPTNPQLILSEWGVGYRLEPDCAARREAPAMPMRRVAAAGSA
ncbi:MAG: response regulator transcription factor [Dehalococcoidia bacterium]